MSIQVFPQPSTGNEIGASAVSIAGNSSQGDITNDYFGRVFNVTANLPTGVYVVDGPDNDSLGTIHKTEFEFGSQTFNWTSSAGPQIWNITTGVSSYKIKIPATWRDVSMSFDVVTRIIGLAYGNGVFVLKGSNGTVAWSTRGTNGNYWSTGTGPGTAVNFTQVDNNVLFFGNGYFMHGNTVTNGALAVSTNGSTWSSVSIVLTSVPQLRKVVYGGGFYFAAPATGADKYNVISSNLTTWSSRAILTNEVGTTLTFAGNYFAMRDSTANGNIWISTDGTTWTTRNTSGAGQFNDLGENGSGLYVAVHANGAITTTTDLSTWTVRSMTGYTSAIYTVRYANGYWIAGTFGGPISSPDGITWTTRNLGFNATLNTKVNLLAYGNSIWIAAQSDDGINSTMNRRYYWSSTPTGYIVAPDGGGAFNYTLVGYRSDLTVSS